MSCSLPVERHALCIHNNIKYTFEVEENRTKNILDLFLKILFLNMLLIEKTSLYSSPFFSKKSHL